MLGDSNACATIAVSDLAAAKEFYEKVLGLAVDQELPEGGGVIYKSGESRVLVYPSQFAGTNKATASSWLVKDVEATVAALKDKGVTFEQYDNLPGATRNGDIHTWGTSKSAWFKDPTGNILNISDGM